MEHHISLTNKKYKFKLILFYINYNRIKNMLFFVFNLFCLKIARVKRHKESSFYDCKIRFLYFFVFSLLRFFLTLEHLGPIKRTQKTAVKWAWVTFVGDINCPAKNINKTIYIFFLETIMSLNISTEEAQLFSKIWKYNSYYNLKF